MNFEDMINKVIQGDCLEVIKNIPDNSIDLIVTDPPYGISYQSSWTDKKDRFDILENDDKILLGWLDEAYRVMKEGTALYLFTRWDVMQEWIDGIKNAGFIIKNAIVWDRVIHSMGDLTGGYAPRYDIIIFATKGRHILKLNRPTDIITCSRVDASKLQHPTQKPVELIYHIIKNSSNIDDIVLDPFFGSGTTGDACIKSNRNFIGIEISPEYCKISEERLKNIPQKLNMFVKRESL